MQAEECSDLRIAVRASGMCGNDCRVPLFGTLAELCQRRGWRAPLKSGDLDVVLVAIDPALHTLRKSVVAQEDLFRQFRPYARRADPFLHELSITLPRLGLVAGKTR